MEPDIAAPAQVVLDILTAFDEHVEDDGAAMELAGSRLNDVNAVVADGSGRLDLTNLMAACVLLMERMLERLAEATNEDRLSIIGSLRQGIAVDGDE